jgi:hypothetical protein
MAMPKFYLILNTWFLCNENQNPQTRIQIQLIQYTQNKRLLPLNAHTWTILSYPPAVLLLTNDYMPTLAKL